MSAIERCGTAALGGHAARCENDACACTVTSYDSCRIPDVPTVHREDVIADGFVAEALSTLGVRPGLDAPD